MRFTFSKYIDKSLFFFLIAFLFFASLKDDTTDLDVSSTLSDAFVNPYIAILKQYAPILAATFIAISFFFALLKFKFRFDLSLAALLICAMPAYAMIRSSAEDLAFTVKMAQSVALFFFMVVFIVFRRKNVTFTKAISTFEWAFFVYSLGITLLSLYTFVSGFGFLGSSRFYGVTKHPNFAGMQMAIAAITFVYVFFTSRTLFKIISFTGLASSGFLLVQTGSRTALIVALIGFSFVWLGVLSRKYKVLTIVAIFMVLVPILYSGRFDTDVYDRGGVNTRAESTAYLVEQVEASPFLGRGIFEGFTENSWLRGWAAFGLPYFLIMFFAMIVTLVDLWRLYRSSLQWRKAFSFLGGLFAALLAGSVLEGYLTDALSAPIVVVVIIVGMVSGLKPAYLREPPTSRLKFQPYSFPIRQGLR